MVPFVGMQNSNMLIHGSLNVPIEHHPTIRYMVYNGYYKVMSNIPKMGHLPIPVIETTKAPSFFHDRSPAKSIHVDDRRVYQLSCYALFRKGPTQERWVMCSY